MICKLYRDTYYMSMIIKIYLVKFYRQNFLFHIFELLLSFSLEKYPKHTNVASDLFCKVLYPCEKQIQNFPMNHKLDGNCVVYIHDKILKCSFFIQITCIDGAI